MIRPLAWLVFGLALAGCGGSRETEEPVLRSRADYDRALQRARLLSEEPLIAFASGRSLTDAQRRDLEEALALFEAMIRFAPTRYGPYLGAGKIARALGNHERAARHLEQGLVLMPAQADLETAFLRAESHAELAEVLLFLGRFESAETHARRALAEAPNSSSYIAVLASVLLQKGDLVGARKQAERALELDPQNSRARGVLRLIEGSRG